MKPIFLPITRYYTSLIGYLYIASLVEVLRVIGLVLKFSGVILSITKGILISNLTLDGVRVEDIIASILANRNLLGLFLVNIS